MDEGGRGRLWLACIGDVIGSRQLPERERVQRDMERLLEQVNREAEEALGSPLGLIRGDEIQGLFRPEGRPLVWTRRLRFHLQRLQPPVRLRIGLGLGQVTTSLAGRHPWEVDGPAFHQAREALREARGSRKGPVRFRSGRQALDEGVNTVLSLVEVLMGRWTPEQWEAIHAYEEAGTYAHAASRLGIAFQNVQKRCAAAHWAQVREAEAYLDRLLAQAGPEA